MRVTNEQLEDIVRGENYGVECDEVNDTNIHAMAADLLEARELITEMRNYFEIVRDNSLNPAHTMTKAGLDACQDANHEIALRMLERSKEYAE